VKFSVAGAEETNPLRVVAEEDRRYLAFSQRSELIVVEGREGYSLVNSIHGTGAVAMVISARTCPLFFALSWTLLLFCMEIFPSNFIRIL
jgi:hypothetical protein